MIVLPVGGHFGGYVWWKHFRKSDGKDIVDWYEYVSEKLRKILNLEGWRRALVLKVSRHFQNAEFRKEFRNKPKNAYIDEIFWYFCR